MTILDLVLLVKIVGAGALSAIPLLFGTPAQAKTILGINETAVPLLRLYGVAVTALLTGYAFGFSAWMGDDFPWGVVAMGLVSNGGATITLLRTGWVRRTPQVTGLVALVTVGLVFCASFPQAATRSLL